MPSADSRSADQGSTVPRATRPAASDRLTRARYRRIMRFATVHMVQEWWFGLVLPRIGLGALSRRGRAARFTRIARRFHVLAVELGGLMIKVGQFLSSRMDVLPPEITRELESLQDEVPPVPLDQIRQLAEAELGVPLARAYASFDPVPVAAASLGQVHRARLVASDAARVGFADVVVKVQRPGIDAVIDVDLAALRRIASILARVDFISRRADLPALVEEFATTSRQEIDYLHEAAGAERFTDDTAADPRVATPETVWERTTRRVLTLSDVTAIKITDTDALRAAGIDPAEVAAELARVTFEQLFVHGYFHADPHPGNIFITPIPPSAETSLRSSRHPSVRRDIPPSGEASPADGAGVPGAEASAPTGAIPWTLTFVDFGMMGEIPDSLRRGLQKLLIAVAARDGKGLVASISEVGVLLPSADSRELEQAMRELFDRFGGMGIAQLRGMDPRELEDFARRFRDVIRSMPFQLPENFLLIIRAVSVVSGVCTKLDPAFNMWDAVEPFANRLLREQGGNAVTALARRAVDFAGILARLPRRVDDLVTLLDSGRLAAQVPAIDRRLRRTERATRGAVSAVVFAGLLVGGILLRSSDAVFGAVLMGISIIPLAHAVLTGLVHARR